MVVIFNFVWVWNDFFGPMIFLVNPDMYTLPIGLKFLAKQYNTIDTGPLPAMSLISLVPVIVVFFTAQKYFVQGIVTEGLKG